MDNSDTTYRSEFVLGTQYYRQPTPLPAEWQTDLKKIKSMGMEYIQIRPQWRWHERKEGVYAWDDIDRLLELAEKENLKVIFKFMIETAPDYIFRQYDGYRVGLNDEKIHPIAHGAFYPGGWLPCFDKQAVMSRALKFVTAAVERYRSNQTISIWHAWNEPRSRPIGECTCPESRALYHKWLHDKFGDIENLNNFLGKCWGEFEDVDCPRSTADFAEMFLWRHWAASRVAWRVAEVSRTIKASDPSREIVSHVGMPSVLQDVLADTSDDYLVRQGVDFYGSSLECRYVPVSLGRSWPFLVADWIRAVSSDGYFWINELYPSRGRWEPEIPASRVAMWNWAVTAAGAKGIILWQFRKERLGVETNDAGLVETDGRDNPTSKAVSKVFAAIKANSALLACAKVPKSRIAMVYDFKSDMVSRIEESKHDKDLSLRDDTPFVYAYKNSLQGAYHLFFQANVQVDMVSSHELKRIDDYEMVYLPAMFVVDLHTAAILKNYVYRGGKLLAEGGIAQRDANTWLHTTRPGVGLAELFGLIEVQRVVSPDKKRQVILPGGRKVISTYMNAVFEPTTAEVIGRYADDSPALTVNKFGSGLAMMTGFLPGLANLMEPDESWCEWLREVAADWNVIDGDIPPVSQLGFYVRTLLVKDETITFLFNVTDTIQSWHIHKKSRDLVSGQTLEDKNTIDVKSGSVAILVSLAKESPKHTTKLTVAACR